MFASGFGGCAVLLVLVPAVVIVVKGAEVESKQRGVYEYPKGSGSWWVRIPLGGRKYRREKVGSYPEAVRRFRQHSEKERRRTGPTVEEAFSRFLALKAKVDPAYETAARNFLRDFPPATCLYEFAQMAVLREWKARRERVRKAGTVNREMAFLSGVFRQAIEDGHLEDNMIGRRRLAYMRAPKGRTRWLYPHEEVLLRRELPRDDWEAAEFIIHTGVRRKEQWRLTWDDVQDGILHVEVSKNGQRREIPLNAEAQRILDARRKRGLSRPFPYRNVYSFSQRFNRMVRILGLTGLTLHSLRHTFATRLARLKTPIRVIMSLMGHGSVVQTQRYIHIADEDLQEAVAGLCRPEKRKVPARRKVAC